MAPMNANPTSTPGVALRPLAALVVPVCIALLWPLLRPYDGLNRDGHLYALQALAHAFPGRYSNDLFLLFDSQDSFTVLTRLAAPI